MWTMLGVEDHVHDGDDIGEGLLLLAVEGLRLERLQLRGGELVAALAVRAVAHVVVGFAVETCGAASAVVEPLADPRLDDAHHGADERAGGVVFATVAPGVAHVLDAALVEV